MTIEEKAHECYEKNRELKPKYHIDEEAWMDWFEEGYKRAQEDQPKIKPLEFKEAVAYSPLGEYNVCWNDDERQFDILIDGEWLDSYDGISAAIEACNQHFCNRIMNCFTNTEEDDE